MSVHFPGIGLHLPYIGRTVRILGMEISYFGIFIAMGLVLALFFIILEAKRNRMDVNHHLNAMIGSIILGTVFARLYYVAFYWNLYKTGPSQIFNLRAGGLAVYGAVFGTRCAIWLVCAIEKDSFGKMADIFCVGGLIVQMIGRWGDFFNRCSFGEYTEWPTAMQLPLSVVNPGEVTPLMRERLLTLDGSSFIQCHPAFAYESLWCLILLVALVLFRRKKLFHGEIFLRYLAGYGFGRFFIEYLRTDKMMIPGTTISFNMVISAALFLICTPVLLVRRTMTRKRNAYHRKRRERKYELEEEAEKAQEERELLQSLKGAAANDYEEGYYASQAIPMENGKTRDDSGPDSLWKERPEPNGEEEPQSGGEYAVRDSGLVEDMGGSEESEGIDNLEIPENSGIVEDPERKETSMSPDIPEEPEITAGQENPDESVPEDHSPSLPDQKEPDEDRESETQASDDLFSSLEKILSEDEKDESNDQEDKPEDLNSEPTSRTFTFGDLLKKQK